MTQLSSHGNQQFDQQNICSWVAAEQKYLTAINQRRLVVLSGKLNWSHSIVQALITYFARQSTVPISWQAYGQGFLAQDQANTSNYRHQLGTENNCIFFADTDFHPDAFAALSGTLVAGGIMFWLCEDLACAKSDLFLKRMSQKCLLDEHIYIITPEDELPEQASLSSEVVLPLRCSNSQCITPEQNDAVKAIIKVAQGRRNRPLVLTADRGRGKSSALAIAVAQLLESSPALAQNIIITAPHQQAVAIFFKQLSKSCINGEYFPEKNTFSFAQHNVRFVPVDVLLKMKSAATLLLIDEAAGIPVYLLSQIVANYHRIVFSSTLHGYEGSGRGFTVKFLPQLKKQCPEYKQYHLKQPIRWALNDWLEAFTFDAFLLAAQSNINETQIALLSSSSKLVTRRVSQRELFADETLLSQVFSVLVTAHYQTSPSDVKLLLINHQVRLFVSFIDELVVAVALTIIEGGASIAEQGLVAQSKRRLKDQFLPQSLFLHNGIEQAFSYQYLRVMRIAVHPFCQKKGIGSSLLADVKQYAVDSGFDMLGTSFGANVELLSFWFKADFSLCRLGFSCDKASGEHSALLLQPLTEKGTELTGVVTTEFYRSFSYLLTQQYQMLSTNVVCEILNQWPNVLITKLTSHDVKNINDFSHKARLFDSCVYSLHLWLINMLSKNMNNENVESVNAKTSGVLIARILQKHSVEQLCQHYGFTGKKALNHFIIESIKQLNKSS